MAWWDDEATTELAGDDPYYALADDHRFDPWGTALAAVAESEAGE